MIKIVLAVTKALAGLKEKSITGVNVKSLTQAIFSSNKQSSVIGRINVATP